MFCFSLCDPRKKTDIPNSVFFLSFLPIHTMLTPPCASASNQNKCQHPFSYSCEQTFTKETPPQSASASSLFAAWFSAVDLHDCTSLLGDKWYTQPQSVSRLSGCCHLVTCTQFLCWSGPVCHETNVFYMSVNWKRQRERLVSGLMGGYFETLLCSTFKSNSDSPEGGVTGHKLRTHTHSSLVLLVDSSLCAA